MQCYTELAPPTAVSHAVHLPFLSSKANNLVVAKNSLLQIFEFKSTVTEVPQNGGEFADNVSPNVDMEAADVPLQRTENTAKLVLIAEFPLAGTVISLGRIKALNTKSRGEALLVAFRDAKLSLVEWDPEAFNLNTISIHFYENPDLAGAPWDAELKDTYNFLAVDPGSRCAALKFGTHNFAILPFKQQGLAEEDYDSDLDQQRAERAGAGDGSNGESVPYLPSFVLPLTHLDPALTHPVHLAFLHEYREPTFGIVAASRAAAPSLLAERKDVLTYTVFTLDLEQKASTTLLSVQGLPYDIFQVVPLPLPIGGALLVGGNEIIHVSQAGKANGVAVNELAKLSTSFPLSDQSDLSLRLEGSTTEILNPDNGDVLLILNDGSIFTLTFTLDGRSVSGLTLQPVAQDHGGKVLNCRSSCAVNLGRGRLFIASEDADSVLLGWSHRFASGASKRGQADANADEEAMSADEMEEDDLDDDLYNDTAPVKKVTIVSAEPTPEGTYAFRIHDVLPSLAPIKDVVLSSRADARRIDIPNSSHMPGDLLLATGRGRAGAITKLEQDIIPTDLGQSVLKSARGLWAVHAKKQAPSGVVADIGQDMEANISSDVDYDQYLVVCRAGSSGTEDTVVYEVNGTDIKETSKGEFQREEASTMNVGTLAGGTKVVQVMRSELRTYDSELNMDEIIPIEDEETGTELRIISANFADPYLLLLLENSSIKIFKAGSGGEVEEVECSNLTSVKWLSASLYKSNLITGIFAFLLTPEGALKIFSMSDLDQPGFVAEGLTFLPPLLTADYTSRKNAGKAAITEILAADLGDTVSKSPHLIVRTSTDDLVIYKAFHYPHKAASDPWTKNLRWQKLSQPRLPRYSEEPAMEAEDAGRESTLVALSNVCGYSTVFQRGTSPSFILKEASSAPRVISVASKPVKGLTRFHTSSCQRGFAFIDADDNFRISQLPAETHFGHLGWAVRRYPMASEICALAYHPRDVYIVGTGQTEEYMLPDDTYHYEWKPEDIKFFPRVERGVIKVYDAKTWTLIDTHILEPQEVILCIKTLKLEYSETTHERRALVAVGTSIVHGEDLATKGNIRIFEVITVVPEPGRPETNRRMRLIVKDEVKGAVSAISELGTQGFLIMAQGQKCMVRGLKEDGTLLPVAFMDMQCYVTVLKSLPGTGMLLMGDAFKGVWFSGYTEEPYKMMLFGRSRNRLEVLAAEFLPFEKQLHIIVADADMNLQVLQFDPENPNSMGGLRLLHKSTFHTGHFPSTMHLVHSPMKMPNTSDIIGTSDGPMDVDSEDAGPLHQILHTSQSGTIALITPLSESSYRKLSGLATFLATALEPTCGLNLRAYRAVENELGVAGGSKGVLDGNLLMRWGELGEQRRREGLTKVGAEEWVFRAEREVLSGRGVFGSRV
ncbi:uncharacterized protein EI97DRAFT_389622 [Westerdykella ornata]|uniref:Protein CFT1 n=1 Tax=Westerdykella ornata TaxID=318751 RepID=A0A6A6JZB7_WESOR|nr:uncharacterized protein EI97DRAFT_389622 [Westerdykella ornata]KAF2281188.1 hypothetical protein EI97DRAFT_389622 [Westerdykella ornata]